MTVLKTLLMSYLISVAYGGHLQVGERKSEQSNCSRKECDENGLFVTCKFAWTVCKCRLCKVLFQYKAVYTLCWKCLDKELCFLGFFPDLQTFLPTYFLKHWIDIYNAWTFPDHFPCIMPFTHIYDLLSLGSFLISMIYFNSLGHNRVSFLPRRYLQREERWCCVDLGAYVF